jgi:hypothetical protein
MATPRYNVRLDELREWAKKPDAGLHPFAEAGGTHVDQLQDRIQLLAAECLRLRRREILRLGGFDR